MGDTWKSFDKRGIWFGFQWRCACCDLDLADEDVVIEVPRPPSRRLDDHYRSFAHAECWAELARIDDVGLVGSGLVGRMTLAWTAHHRPDALSGEWIAFAKARGYFFNNAGQFVFPGWEETE